MGRKAGSCCDTFSPAPEVLTGLHWGLVKGKKCAKGRKKKIRFAERNCLQLIQESLKISAAGTCSCLFVSVSVHLCRSAKLPVSSQPRP